MAIEVIIKSDRYIPVGEIKKVLNALWSGPLHRIDLWKAVGGKLDPSFDFVIEKMISSMVIRETNDIISVDETCFSRKDPSYQDATAILTFPGTKEEIPAWRFNGITFYKGNRFLCLLADLALGEYLAYFALNNIITVLKERGCGFQQKHVMVRYDEDYFQKECAAQNIAYDTNLPLLVENPVNCITLLLPPSMVKQSVKRDPSASWSIMFTILFYAVCPLAMGEDKEFFDQVLSEFLKLTGPVEALEARYEGILH